MSRKLMLSTVLCLATFSLASADDLRLQIGYWPGERTPELEQRFLMDDLSNGTVANRLDLLPWTGRETMTLYPLGAAYFIPAAGGRAVFAANYVRYQPEYAYTGIGPSPSLSTVTLDHYKTTDWELEAGYELPLLEKKLLLTPKIGFRQTFTEFNYNELTVGNGTARISSDSVFQAQSRNLGVGIGGQFHFADKLSFVGDYMLASPAFSDWGGSMTEKRTVIGITGSNPSLQYDDARADYQTKVFRWSAGIQYDAAETVHVQIGIRQEVVESTYPGYYNIPILLSGGSAGLANTGTDIATEFILDRVFYEQKQKSTKGFVYFAFMYDLKL